MEQPFDYDGPSLTLRGAVCAPRPVQRPHPPIMVAGSGDRMLRIVAEHADLWNYPGGLDDAFAERNATLVRHCQAIGRDPATIIRSMQLIVRTTEEDAVPKAQATIERMIDAGVQHIVLAAVFGDHGVQWLADEVLRPFS